MKSPGVAPVFQAPRFNKGRATLCGVLVLGKTKATTAPFTVETGRHDRNGAFDGATTPPIYSSESAPAAFCAASGATARYVLLFFALRLAAVKLERRRSGHGVHVLHSVSERLASDREMCHA
jgi:hypothetical protein